MRRVIGKQPIFFIVVLTDADKYPGAASCQLFGRLAGVFQGFPTDFQKEAMLGVDTNGLTWRNTEKLRIERIHLIQESPFSGVDFAHCIGIGIVKSIHVPPAVRKIGNCMLTLVE